MGYTDGNFKTFTAGEALAKFRRVKYSSSTVVYADAGEEWIGTTLFAAASAAQVTVKLRNGSGTHIVTAAGTFAEGAQLYGADDGKVDDAAAGQVFGIALEAATASGDEIEVVPAVDNSSPNYDITYGPVLSGGAEQDTFETDTTKNYALGTRRITPAGEVYYYAKAGTLGVVADKAAAFMKACVTSSATSLNEALHVAADAGAYTIVMEQAGVALNAFAGGYCTIGGGAALTEKHRIVSNTASADSTNHVTITLAEPLRTARTTDWTECGVSPWSDTQDISSAANVYASWGGIPAVDCAAGSYYWCQTWGITFINPGTDTPGSTAMSREVYFNSNGTVMDAVTVLGSGTAGHAGAQRAGFTVYLDSAGVNGPPYVMLQIAP